MSRSQSLKPLQNQQKSALTQIEMSRSQSLKPLQNQQKVYPDEVPTLQAVTPFP